MSRIYIGGVGIGDKGLGPASRAVELRQFAAILKGRADGGQPDIGVGVVGGLCEVSDGAQHESLELVIGDIKGGVVQASQLVDKLGLFHPALHGTEADPRAAGSISEGGGGDDYGQSRALTQCKAGC